MLDLIPLDTYEISKWCEETWILEKHQIRPNLVYEITKAIETQFYHSGREEEKIDAALLELNKSYNQYKLVSFGEPTFARATVKGTPLHSTIELDYTFWIEFKGVPYHKARKWPVWLINEINQKYYPSHHRIKDPNEDQITQTLIRACKPFLGNMMTPSLNVRMINTIKDELARDFGFQDIEFTNVDPKTINLKCKLHSGEYYSTEITFK